MEGISLNLKMKKKSQPGYFAKLLVTRRRRLLTGLLIAAPVYVTYLAVRFILRTVDGFSQPIVKGVVGTTIPGLGFILTLVILYFLGLITASVFGKSLFAWIDVLLLKLPGIRHIYAATKQVVDTVSLPSKESFKKVVLAEYPRKGLFSIGFVTGSTRGPEGKTLLTVFIPSPPNPTTGQLIFVPEEEIVDTTLSIEEGVKIVISGGFLTPKEITRA